MSTHSPGPWRWESGEDGDDRLVDRDGYSLVEGMLFPRDGDERDDLLIAAAPELLAALELLVGPDTRLLDRCRFTRDQAILDARTLIRRIKGTP